MNANHMSVMKTSLTIIPMCPRERFSHYKKSSRLVLCYKKDWATLLHFIYFHSLLPITNYLITKLSITESRSAPWVVLVINVNISLVGLTLLPSIFKISSTMKWHGQKDVEPLQDTKDKGLGQAPRTRLYIFYFSDPRSH